MLVCEAIGYPDGAEDGERRVDRRDVVGEAGLDGGEEEELDEGEDREGANTAEAWLAEGVVEGDGVEKNEGSGGEEQDTEVVPPGGDVAFDLDGGAGEDVEAEVAAEEHAAEAVEHG